MDVLCRDGSAVHAPFTGMIMGQEKPYKTKNAINNGVRISGQGDVQTRESPGGVDIYMFDVGSIHKSTMLP